MERLVRFPVKTVLTVLGLIIVVWGLLHVIVIARSVIVYILIAIFLTLAINPLVELLIRRGMRSRGLASGTACLIVLVAIAGIGYAFIPTLIDNVNNFVDAAPGYVHDLTHGRVRTFYAIWRRPWMSVSLDTYIADVLARAGAENVCSAAAARYPVVEPEQVAAADARLVLLASEPWAFTSRDRDELAAHREFGAAVIALCDGRDFCWHGAHTAFGLRRAASLLLPHRPAIAAS